MKSYKVEINQVVTYVLDVQGENEEQARDNALQKWVDVTSNGEDVEILASDVTLKIKIYDKKKKIRNKRKTNTFFTR